jgi:hypothetical protein
LSQGKEKYENYIRLQIRFFFLAKNLLLFLNNFYKFYAQNEWEYVRQKIPPELSLYGTIFTLIAANINSCFWHTDLLDLQFAIIIYFGKWDGGCIKLELPKTPFKIKLNNIDILFLKSSKIWHFIDCFPRIRKSLSIYAHSFISTPTGIDGETEHFLLQ